MGEFRVGRTRAQHSYPEPRSNGLTPFPNPAWLVPNWYVNWLTGNDANDGLTSATAVKTIMGGIVISKWRTNEPELAPGITTIHVEAAEPVGAELIILRPFGNASVLIIDGTDGSTVIASGQLSAVTMKIYGDPGQTLNATSPAFAASQVGDIVINSDHSSSSAVHALLGPSQVELNQPVTGYQGALTFFPTPAEVDTWAPFDHVQVLRPPTLNLAVLTMSGGYDEVPNNRAILLVQSIRVLDPSSMAGNSTFAPFSNDCTLQFFDCTFEPYVNLPFTDFLLATAINCIFLGGATVPNGSVVYAGSIDGFGCDVLGGYIGFDCNVSQGMVCTLGNCRLGRVRITNTPAPNVNPVFVYPSCTVYQVVEEPMGPNKAAVWGPGGINLFGNAGWFLTGAPTWVGALYTTSLFLNSDPTGSSFNAGAAGNPYTASIALSAANLQAAPDHSLQQPTRGAKFAFSA